MGIYNERHGLRYDLQCRWEEGNAKQFPSYKSSILQDYEELEKELNKRHENVNLGLAVAGDGLLTDHGIVHVNSVMTHAKDIISDVQNLTGYEIFLLLIAIHFHDLGNISGREGHEQKISEIMDELDEYLPLDIAEKEIITDIATAHGGYVDGDKDTIRYVATDTMYGGVVIRPKLLAAILRFADEIADDCSRSNFKGIEIPHENQIYHSYSKALDPVSIVGETIKFHFRIPYEETQIKLGKGGKEVYLYDEILERMAKCMREMEYCKKFDGGIIRPTTLDVTIDFMEAQHTIKVKDSDSFRLTLHGYPDKSHSQLLDYLEETGNSTNSGGLRFADGDAVKKAMA